MSTLRFDALKASMNRTPQKVDEASKRSSIYGANVFRLSVMQTYLPKATFKKLLKKARCQYELHKCDITVHKDITLHSGGINYTENIRAFLFVVCDVKN